VTVHTGLFELGGVLMEEFRLPLVVLSLPEPSAALNRWRAAYRQGWGAETLEVGREPISALWTSRASLHRVSVSRCLWIDRMVMAMWYSRIFPHGRVPFSTGPVWLSLFTGAPLVAVKCWPTGSGQLCAGSIAAPALAMRPAPTGRDRCEYNP